MCDCAGANKAASKKPEEKRTACKSCEVAKKGGVKWEKQPGATDEDMAKAKKLWEEAKKRRLPDGSKPQTVQGMEALEKSDKTTTIKVGPKGNYESPNNASDALDPKKGSDTTIHFNPNKKGTMSDGTTRDPESSLAHEAFHAYRDTQGASVKDPGWKTEELAAGNAENEHRAAKGIPQRKKYGNKWPLKEYKPPAK